MNFTAQFIDLFSGCGGLSLGLMNAGWRGIFAVEKSRDAFKTLKHNLIQKGDHNLGKPRFRWPSTLDIQPYEIKSFIRKHKELLHEIQGKVQLVAGGPPCQGFSFAGKRTGNDPRNELFKYHLQIVDIVKPALVLMENVQGIEIVFGVGKKKSKRKRGRPRKSYASRIKGMLEKHDYVVQQHVIKASRFGVPQYRPRYYTLGIRKDLLYQREMPDFGKIMNKVRYIFLGKLGLSLFNPVTVSQAISDLKTKGKMIVKCMDPESPPGFKEIVYNGPRSCYQKLMHRDLNGRPLNSMRLVNHRRETILRFQLILDTCRKGVGLSDADRERLGLRKTAITPLAPNKPSHTLTTLPDDLLHYAEPRIHTVRENARLQSFPDWFEFRGNYTTGGDRRANECPRYTQVGNAVPPLLAEAIGEALFIIQKDLGARNDLNKCSK